MVVETVSLSVLAASDVDAQQLQPGAHKPHLGKTAGQISKPWLKRSPGLSFLLTLLAESLCRSHFQLLIPTNGQMTAHLFLAMPWSN